MTLPVDIAFHLIDEIVEFIDDLHDVYWWCVFVGFVSILFIDF